MFDNNLLSYIPLHLSVLDRSSGLVEWVKSWWLKDEDLEQLFLEG